MTHDPDDHVSITCPDCGRILILGTNADQLDFFRTLHPEVGDEDETPCPPKVDRSKVHPRKVMG